eukprot:TRINITY_DN3698_c0_g1_i2.p1 TRINITY_DN3698_c0_g1~~TRINITY_DN3698_c0_g1_i2.p1  ORF type:complete len:241 (+),score=15.88 TRINITY_DN3698_c0_g1_i2:60-782(+)
MNWLRASVRSYAQEIICSAPHNGDDYDHLFEFMLVGDSEVGKSWLLQRFTEDLIMPRTYSKRGVDFKMRTVPVGDKIIRLQIWDVGGRDCWRDIRSPCYPRMTGFLVVYDVTNPHSLANASHWFIVIRQLAPPKHWSILIANKTDLPSATSWEEGLRIAQENNAVAFYEASAHTGNGVGEAFMGLAEAVTTAWASGANYIPPKAAVNGLGITRGCRASAPAAVATKEEPVPATNQRCVAM